MESVEICLLYKEVVSSASNAKPKTDVSPKNADNSSAKNSVKYGIPVDLQWKSTIDGRFIEQEWGPEQFPLNVLIYANDVLGITPEEFLLTDLEFQFSLEDMAGVII